ncbi:MAG: preprotein translocase subunit SecA [Candidatus Cloacimonetes bacterium]|nr:preprotein translocase subunit SecA [Candidatus Cloacimonadota bacterium]MBS3766867.1 preprotein translocase subunit SecA [Candidatus Cloacimonadota bacterium]
MLHKLLTKIFGTEFQRELKKIQPLVDGINQNYEKFHELSDDELKAKTEEFKSRINKHIEFNKNRLHELEKQYEETEVEAEKDRLSHEIDRAKDKLNDSTREILDELLTEAFAVVKETCRRLVGEKWNVRGQETEWDMIPYDVQIIGGIVMYQGKVAEMKTGEGKTLAATMPLYLYALAGKGAHLVTVNDYLAQRDAEWMGKIYKYLGLSVGCIHGDMDPQQRKEQYGSDITYGTNNEFGFDYLRDNMAISPEGLVQREYFYCIVDEVDSILIDEARTPLIISGAVEDSKNYYRELNPQIRKLVNKQTILANRLLKDIKKINEDGIDKENEFEFGEKLLTVKRAAPKSKKFLKLIKDGNNKKIMQDVEGQYIREKKLHLVDEDLYYSIDESTRSADLTDKGQEELSKYDESLFIMPDLDEAIEEIDADDSISLTEKQNKKKKVQDEFLEKNEKLHNIKQMLVAYSLYEKDVDYIVKDDSVVIVDQFTGRLMPGRRFSEGLHQALEAKEMVKIQQATQTLATITLQNYFRMYNSLAGMTGTAVTEAGEFKEIYDLAVVEIPTNEPVRRIDHDDLIYRTKREKYNAIINEIEHWHSQKRPVLVGTISVEVSEVISRLLKRKGIPHEVLNAKHHQKEAEIVAYAGQPGSVTIATNMAGRGTDIKLGKGVVKCDKCIIECEENCDEAGKNAPADPKDCIKEEVPCGLHIMGTERHESRRIDRQLRGRSGRQGDPGSSRFYLSLEDDLMRIFGSDRIAGLMAKMGLEDGEAIKHPWMTKAVENAQKRVEGHNFEIRKQLLKYDDVMNQQREVIYNYREKVLKGENLRAEILEMIEDTVANHVTSAVGNIEYEEAWPVEDIYKWFENELHIELEYPEVEDNIKNEQDLIYHLYKQLLEFYKSKEEDFEEQQRALERYSVLKVVDAQWKDHLYNMDRLKEGISLRAYGQKDPLIEYKKESFELFMDLTDKIKEEVVKNVFTLYPEIFYRVQQDVKDVQLSHKGKTAFEEESSEKPAPEQQSGGPNKQQASSNNKPQPRRVEKVGRNDPCPCGSGKKYKHCCGKRT